MSFPFVQPYFGLGNSLQTAQAGGAGGAGVGGWVELARTTLGSAGDTMEVSSLSDKRYYMVLVDTVEDSGAISSYLRLGNGSTDTGSNYAYRYSGDGATDATGTSASGLLISNSGLVIERGFQVNYITNKSANEKLVLSHTVQQNTAGASNVPFRYEAVGKWANTSNPLDTITAYNGAAGDLASGSECVVLGWDPADTHTTNFWEELASVTLGSDGDVLSSGTISAKKYLWVQAFIKNSGTSARFNTEMTFNGDTGSNYAERRSLDGAADATSTSQSKIMSSGVTGSDDDLWVLNMFVVNNSATEKLCIGHGFDTYAGSGAGTAPSQRFEKVAKWSNTSSQITNITITNSDTSNYDAISELRVWGSN
jgi:hypothetical protein